MNESIAGISIPDTQLAAAATDLVRGAVSDLLFHHSRRVYLFGALQGQLRGLEVDLEQLYVAAMFHDVGLTAAYGTNHLRFEVDGANAARDFLRAQGVPEDRISNVWAAVALHTTPGIPEFLSPEIALVTAGVETDVLGIGYENLDPELVDAVTAAHPRPGFKRGILEAFRDGNVHRPDTTFGNVNSDVLAHFSPDFARTDFVDVIRGSAWPE